MKKTYVGVYFLKSKIFSSKDKAIVLLKTKQIKKTHKAY